MWFFFFSSVKVLISVPACDKFSEFLMIFVKGVYDFFKKISTPQ